MISRSMTTGAAAALLALIAPCARADVHYALDVTTPPGETRGRLPSHWTVSYWIKGAQERAESAFAPGILNRVCITQGDTNREFEVDAAEKIYTARHVGVAGLDFFVPPSPIYPRAADAPSSETPATGTSAIEFSIEDKGTETLNDLDTRHCIVMLHQKVAGCARVDFDTVTLELWVSDAKPGRLDCPQRFGVAPSASGQPAKPSAKVPAGCAPVQSLSGNMAGLRDIFSHAIVKATVTVDGKPAMTMRMKEYSTVPLPAALFTVPASFKMLSRSEFEARERSLMEARLLETTPDGGPRPAIAVDDGPQEGPDYAPPVPNMNGQGQPGPAAAPPGGDDGDDMPALPNPGADVKSKVRPWLRL